EIADARSRRGSPYAPGSLDHRIAAPPVPPPPPASDAHGAPRRLLPGRAAVTLHTSFSVGRLRCHALEGGRQRLDGGAMFGVVPRTLWKTRIEPDERNRIPLAMRCVLIEHPDGLVLIDTALGNKEDAKFLDIYGVENQGLEGATQLEDALASAGYLSRDVNWVVNTHLHFDHA